MQRLVLLVALILIGCGVNPGKNPDPVELTGTVTHGGKPVDGLTLNLQATGRGAQAVIPVKNGQFKSSVMPGKYTYFLSEGTKPGVFRLVPEKLQFGSLDRQVEISAGKTLDITLD